jgi:hypothetical protein
MDWGRGKSRAPMPVPAGAPSLRVAVVVPTSAHPKPQSLTLSGCPCFTKKERADCVQNQGHKCGFGELVR